MPHWMHPEIIQSPTTRGVRYGLWPFFLEVYIGNTEPDLAYSRKHGTMHNRIILWRDHPKEVLPPGWRTFSKDPDSLIGYSAIPEDGLVTRTWSRRTRDYAQEWKKKHQGHTHVIELVDYETFETWYRKSSAARALHSVLLHELQRRLRSRSTVVEMWCVKELSSGIYTAGAAFEYSETHKSVYYISGYYLESTSKVQTMIGLFAFMFERAQKKGMRYMDMGVFWRPGEPKSWQGFSKFKAKFGTQFYEMPPVAMRIETIGIMSHIRFMCRRLFQKIKFRVQ